MNSLNLIYVVFLRDNLSSYNIFKIKNILIIIINLSFSNLKNLSIPPYSHPQNPCSPPSKPKCKHWKKN